MPGFDSGGFDAGGFDAFVALDVTAQLDRYIAEQLGGFADVTVSRALLEALVEPELFHQTVDRYTGEVLFENIPIAQTLTRYTVEVLGDFPFILAPLQTITRVVAEVLGLASMYAGKRAELG